MRNPVFLVAMFILGVIASDCHNHADREELNRRLNRLTAERDSALRWAQLEAMIAEQECITSLVMRGFTCWAGSEKKR